MLQRSQTPLHTLKRLGASYFYDPVVATSLDTTHVLEIVSCQMQKLGPLPSLGLDCAEDVVSYVRQLLWSLLRLERCVWR